MGHQQRPDLGLPGLRTGPHDGVTLSLPKGADLRLSFDLQGRDQYSAPAGRSLDTPIFIPSIDNHP